MIYLLDTNVVSELRKGKSKKIDRRVTAWAGSVPAESMYLSVISLFEIEVGVLLKERGDPRQGTILRAWYKDRVLPAFAGRILDIDAQIAARCAALHVPDRRSFRDSLIAATAMVHGMTVATRNVSDFEPTGVTVFNPWKG